jgi:hypothetical protein
MFSTQFQEADAGTIKLEVAESSSTTAMLLAIEYIYTRDVFIDGDSADSAMELLAAADMLQLIKLKNHCASGVGYIRVI